MTDDRRPDLRPLHGLRHLVVEVLRLVRHGPGRHL